MAVAEEVIPSELVTVLVMTTLIEDGSPLVSFVSEMAAEPPESAFDAAASLTVDMLGEHLDELELFRGLTPVVPRLWVKVVHVEIGLDFELPRSLSSAVFDTVKLPLELFCTAELTGSCAAVVVMAPMGPLLEVAVLDAAMAET